MALVQITLRALQCDGCKVLFEDGRHFELAMEARALAYAAGWRFIPKVTIGGLPSKNTSDVCPECIPGFVPIPDGSHQYNK